MKGQTSGAVSAISTLTPTTTSLSANTDFYKGSVLYISSGAGAGQQRTISEYIVTGSARRVLTATEFDTAIDSTSRFEISPRVVVDGDGSGVQARAIVILHRLLLILLISLIEDLVIRMHQSRYLETQVL
jgi:hypothetical protein